MAGFTEVGGLRPPPSRRGERVGAGRYVAAGGLGWRERLISQAPQLGRMGGGALSSPPVYAARSPRPADARRWAALRSEPGITSARTLRGSEDAYPCGRRREEREKREDGGQEAERRRGRQPIRQKERGGEGKERGRRAASPPGGEAEGDRRAEPRSVRADGNRGSERGEGDERGERVGAGALCASGWPELARAADLARSAARPNGGHSPLPRSTRHSPPPAPLTRAGGRRAAPNRGFRLPARSAAPRVPPHPAEGERRRRREAGRTEPRSVRADSNRGSERGVDAAKR